MIASAQVWSDLLWRSALAATIPAIAVIIIGRFLTIRPPTRHALWLVILALFVAAPLLPAAPLGKIGSVLTPVETKQPAQQVSIAAPASLESQVEDSLRRESSLTSAPLPQWVERPSRPSMGEMPMPPDRDSIHALTGPVPERLARAPRSVGHGLDMRQITREETISKAQISSDERLERVQRQEIRPGPSSIRRHKSKSKSPIQYEAKESPDDQAIVPSVTAASTPLAQIETAIDDRAAAPSAIATWMDACRTAIASVKSAIARIPPIPTPVWIAGIALIVLARVLACLRFARRLRASRRAPSAIQRMVRRSARVIGVSPAPQVLMTAGRVSPMVSFIGKRRLLLPTELWSQLDEPGRQAIVFHELAHLRRRDDWVRWFENGVNCLYWWHPVVWWICRRLREEAETCCDVWVTWLMPSGRRAYAEALLKTSQYVGSSSTALPAVGIGATSVRARRFARRLTMVMTNPSRPRMSLPGAALATALAVAAWMATPAWSNPPSPDQPAPVATPAESVTPSMNATPAAMPVPPAAPVAPLAPVSTLVAPTPAPPAMPALTPPALLDAIGTSVAKGLMSVNQYPPEHRKRSSDGDLEARLDRLERRLEELAERLGHQPGAPRSPRAIAIPRGEGQPQVISMSPRARSADGGAKEWRHYSLPEGKLKALIALMARDDVPVLVQQQEGGIEVEATPGQHEIFGAFVRMINPTGGGSGGAPAVRMRQPRTPPPGARGRGAGRAGPSIRLRADEIRSQVDAKEAEMDAIEAKKDQLESMIDALHERADELKEKAQSLKAEAKEKAKMEVAEILKKARASSADMEKLEVVLKKAAEELRVMEREADGLEDRADADNDNDDDDDGDAEDEEARAGAPAPAAQAVKEALEARAQSKKAAVKDKAKVKEQAHTEGAQKAEELFNQYKWPQAAAAYEEMLKTHGDDGRAWYNLGYSYHMAKDYEKALKAFERSIELDSRKGDSLYNIACGYSLRGDKDKAIEWLNKAVEEGYSDANNMKADSDLNNIRNDERYKEIVESL